MDVVTLSLSDLTKIHAAVNSAYHQNLAMDMVDSYRRLNRQARGSDMTLALKDALDTAATYIQTHPTTTQETADVPSA